MDNGGINPGREFWDLRYLLFGIWNEYRSLFLNCSRNSSSGIRNFGADLNARIMLAMFKGSQD